MRSRLTFAAIPASVLLRHIYPRDPSIFLLHSLSILFDSVLMEAGAEYQLVIWAHWALCVSYDLNHANAAQGSASFRIYV